MEGDTVNDLVAAIDSAVEFVRTHAHPDEMTRAEMGDFSRLANGVYLLASRAGLTHALPQVAELRPQLESSDLPPVQFETKLNLPVDWDHTEQVFLVTATDRWFDDMAMLRTLAADPPTARTSPVGEPVEQIKESPLPAETGSVPGVKQSSMSRQEAAVRLKRLHARGEPWPGYRKLATDFGCSTRTLYNAVHETPELHDWAKPKDPDPRAQSLNEIVIDRTPQSSEPNPEDEAAVREFIERADPETKAWFLSLPSRTQSEVACDPDRHQKILGRKP